MKMNSFVSLAFCLSFAYGTGVEETAPAGDDTHVALPDMVRDEIMKSFPGVNNETLLVDFLSNATYVDTVMSIQLQMCYIDALHSHSRQKRNVFANVVTDFKNLFPKDFWVTDVHKGYYHYLKHLDPVRWWHEAFDWIEVKSSLPPLYYVAKYCPEELRFLRNMNYTEDFYPNLTWPPGLDPLWTGDPNMTTNIFTLLTESSSSESLSWEPYSGESTTTEDPANVFWKFDSKVPDTD